MVTVTSTPDPIEERYPGLTPAVMVKLREHDYVYLNSEGKIPGEDMPRLYAIAKKKGWAETPVALPGTPQYDEIVEKIHKYGRFYDHPPYWLPWHVVGLLFTPKIAANIRVLRHPGRVAGPYVRTNDLKLEFFNRLKVTGSYGGPGRPKRRPVIPDWPWTRDPLTPDMSDLADEKLPYALPEFEGHQLLSHQEVAKAVIASKSFNDLSEKNAKNRYLAKQIDFQCLQREDYHDTRNDAKPDSTLPETPYVEPLEVTHPPVVESPPTLDTTTDND